jgi:hypothetical protein
MRQATGGAAMTNTQKIYEMAGERRTFRPYPSHGKGLEIIHLDHELGCAARIRIALRFIATKTTIAIFKAMPSGLSERWAW